MQNGSPNTDDSERLKELEALRESLKQLDLLKEDMEIVIRFANPHLVGQANQYATGVPSADPAVREKCRKFVERYRHLVR